MKRRFLYDHGVNAEGSGSYGERLVANNPQGSPSIPDIKASAANFIDCIHDTSQHWDAISPKRKQLFDQAENLALQAQMMAVKAATLMD